MSMHLRELTVGDGKRPSVVKRHQARNDWIKQNLRIVLKSIGIGLKSAWEVQPILVLDTVPMSPLFTEVSMPVVSLDMLKTRWSVS
jgi:hypothetical protein